MCRKNCLFNKCLKSCALIAIILSSFAGKQAKAQPKDYYKPSPLIISSHRQPKELLLTVGYDRGLDFGASVSLPFNFIVYAKGNLNTFSHSRDEPLEPRYTINKNDYSWLSGVGYFGHRRYKFFNVIEMYSGIGNTKIDNFRRYSTSLSEDNDRFTKANYRTAFGQINAIAAFKTVELGVAAKVSYNLYKDFEYYIGTPAITNRNTDDFAFVNFEPALSLSYLLLNFKGNLQLGVSVPLFSHEAEIVELPREAISTENYEDFYFFWRLSLQYLKQFDKRYR
ncbi:MAG: hypothetical protein ACLFNU_05315 [Bacteroidales bacterium]